MQTIEEYKEYTKQLEGEVGKWHNAYDALVNMNQQKLTEKGAKMPKKEIDKYTFKICEAVKLGIDKFFLEENKPIKITEAHTDFAKRIIPTLPRCWMQQKHSWDACKS